MSSWFRYPANSSIRGTPVGLPPAGTALLRASGGHYIRPSCGSGHGRITARDTSHVQVHSSTIEEKNQEVVDKVTTVPTVVTTAQTIPEPANVNDDTMHELLTDASGEVASNSETIEGPHVSLSGESSQSADITLMFDREPL